MSKIKLYNSLMLLAGTRVILEKRNSFPIGNRYQGAATFCDTLIEKGTRFEPGFVTDVLITDKETDKKTLIKIAKADSSLPSSDLVGEMSKMSRKEILEFLQKNDDSLVSKLLKRKYSFVFGDKRISDDLSQAIINEADSIIEQAKKR